MVWCPPASPSPVLIPVLLNSHSGIAALILWRISDLPFSCISFMSILGKKDSSFLCINTTVAQHNARMPSLAIVRLTDILAPLSLPGPVRVWLSSPPSGDKGRLSHGVLAVSLVLIAWEVSGSYTSKEQKSPTYFQSCLCFISERHLCKFAFTLRKRQSLEFLWQLANKFWVCPETGLALKGGRWGKMGWEISLWNFLEQL